MNPIARYRGSNSIFILRHPWHGVISLFTVAPTCRKASESTLADWTVTALKPADGADAESQPNQSRLESSAAANGRPRVYIASSDYARPPNPLCVKPKVRGGYGGDNFSDRRSRYIDHSWHICGHTRYGNRQRTSSAYRVANHIRSSAAFS